MRQGGRVRATRPVSQLREGAYALRGYLENDERWQRQLVRVEHLLVTPYDEQQRVFPRFGRPPLGLVPLMLDHNLRNTHEIAEVFRPLAPSGMEVRGGHGAAVEFVAAGADKALGAGAGV